jgi:hypothetical protein
MLNHWLPDGSHDTAFPFAGVQLTATYPGGEYMAIASGTAAADAISPEVRPRRA